MNFKAILKVILGIGLSLLVLVGLIFSMLPGPREIGEIAGLVPEDSSTYASKTSNNSEKKPETGKELDSNKGLKISSEKKPQDRLEEKKEFDRLLINVLVESVREGEMEKFNFCEGIRNQRSSIKNRSEAFKIMKTSGRRVLAEDPAWMALNGPMYSMLSSPAMKRVAEHIADDDSQSFLHKIEFYYDTVLALKEIAGNRPRVEKNSRHFYYLYVLSRLQEIHPEAITDEGFNSVCERLNSLIHSQTVAEISLKDMELLLTRMGVRKSDVGFSRDLGNSIVKSERNGEHLALGIETPWVDQILEDNSER